MSADRAPSPLLRAWPIAAWLAACVALSVARAALAGTLRVDETSLPNLPWALLGALWFIAAAGASSQYLDAISSPTSDPWPRLVAGALLIHAVAALALPLTSNDLFSNLGYARLSHFGWNPYLYGPRALPPDDPFLALVGQRWIDTPIVYGPLLAGLDAALGLFPNPISGLIALKLIMAATGAAIVLVARRACATLPEPAARTAFLFIAWNPLLAWEVTAQAHNDGVMVLAMVAFVWAARAGREWLAVAALAAALYAKFGAAPVLVLYLAYIARRAPLRALAMAAFVVAAGALAFAPFFHGISTFAGPFQAAASSPDRVTRSLTALVVHLVDPLGPAARSHAYQACYFAGTALLAGLALRALVRARTLAHVLHDGLVLLLLYDLVAAPWFQTWYATWLLPLAMVEEDPRWRRLIARYSAVCLVQYALDVDPFVTAAIDLYMLWQLSLVLRPVKTFPERS